MKKWFQPPMKNEEVFDEHSEPTEPLPPLVLPLVPSPVADEGTQPLAPSAIPTAPGFTTLPGMNNPSLASPYSPPVQQYPYLPQNPTTQKGQKLPVDVTPPKQPGKLIPLSVGMCFVIVQLLLVLRLAQQAISIFSPNTWLNTVQGVSDLFVLPFYWLLQTLFPSLSLNTWFYTSLAIVLAIIVYGLLSRLLVHLLKIFLARRV